MERLRQLTPAYSNTELGEKQLSLGRVLIFCDGVGSWLQKSIRYQPVKGLPFICFQIVRGPFGAPSAHEIAEDGEFFAADCEGFCHWLLLREGPIGAQIRRPFALGPRACASPAHFDCYSGGSAIV